MSVAGEAASKETTSWKTARVFGGFGTKNLIIKNSAARNSPNYNLATDNAVGEIIDVTGLGGVPFTSGSPWANFVHEPALP